MRTRSKTGGRFSCLLSLPRRCPPCRAVPSRPISSMLRARTSADPWRGGFIGLYVPINRGASWVDATFTLGAGTSILGKQRPCWAEPVHPPSSSMRRVRGDHTRVRREGTIADEINESAERRLLGLPLGDHIDHLRASGLRSSKMPRPFRRDAEMRYGCAQSYRLTRKVDGLGKA